MGLFNFFQRKPPPPPQTTGLSTHYAFAHLALRQIALSDPLQFLAIVVSPDAEQFFGAILQDVAEQCGCQVPFDATKVKVHPTRVDSYPCAVIELPEPQEVAEAIMVALVVLVDTSTEQPPEAEEVQGRFFTLEKGFSLDNTPRTVLAEWDDRSHSNYGDGPEPTVAAFAAAIGEHL